MRITKIKKKSKILVKAKLIAEQVELNDKEYSTLSFDDLKKRTLFLIEGLQNYKFLLDDIIVDAFSIIREAVYRVHGLKAYNVQIMGAYVVHCGDFAEMFTGEGKTVTILIVSFLNALLKKGVHIVTVNEYLVKRDAEFSNMVLEKLGMSAGYNVSQMSKDTKQQMFGKDVTYTTNSELGFDYLRDNLSRSLDEKVIRSLDFVIVDEGDSVLIDESRTPLIISGMPSDDFSLYLECDKFVSSLNINDYIIDNETNSISLSDIGVTKAEQFFNIKKLYSLSSSDIVHKITNALIAHFIFANGKEYIVKNELIYLVDQFTGRILEGRSYSAGLQQSIQAKEKVKIEPENIVMATITYQSFFRLYNKLGSVSGTALTEAEEFLKIYNMVVVQIPTNKPIVRVDKPDYIFGNKEFKWKHVIEEIISRNKIGQPILVGTASVSDSEIISKHLRDKNIDHQVLNARDNTQEAEIVKRAGNKFSITISTNMAGRGTDIKVGKDVVELGGLYVIGTERHESRRIDNQLRGRTGRQGDPGESRFFTSLEDSLFKRFATDKFEKASKKLEADFYDSKFFSKMLDRTQKKVEGLNFDIRKNLMEYDHVLSLQRELIYKQRDQILSGKNNIKIIENMGKDFVVDVIEKLKSPNNSIMVDSERLVFFINIFVIKFHYFKNDYFMNDSLSDARDKLFFILMLIINVKIDILTKSNGLSVLGEILLSNLDHKWTLHIDKMTKLREGVSLRSLEQKMPLNIYIEDGNKLFEKMKFSVVEAVFTSFLKLSLPNEELEIRKVLESNFEKSTKIEKVQKIDFSISREAEEAIHEIASEPIPEIIFSDETDIMNTTEHSQSVVINEDLDIINSLEKQSANIILNSKQAPSKKPTKKVSKSKPISKINTKKSSSK